MNRGLSANRESTQMLINGDRYHRALQPTEASPPAPLRMERGAITEIPLHVLQMFSSLSPSISRPIGVTSHTPPLSIRRGAGGEASVNSVCRRPSVGSKLCAKMLCKLCGLCERKKYPTWENEMSSVREKTPLQLSSILSLTVGVFFFSQNNTDEQNTLHFTETLSQPISQNLTPTFSYNVLWTLYAGGLLWVRNSVQMGSVISVSSVRKRYTLCEGKTSPASCLCVIS